MSKIVKLINHIKRGTASRRIQFEKVKKKALNNEAKWNRFQSRKDHTVKTILFDEIKLVLDKNSSLSKSLFRGDFEYQEVQFLKTFLRDKDIFVDIGANIGYFSIIASKKVKQGKVYSFEPTEKTFERLENSIKINECKNIHAFQIALSDKSEEREFTVSNDGFDAYNSLGNPSQGENFTRSMVQTSTFDEFKKQNNIPNPTIIKIDVEGWEIPVLNGMKDTLSTDNAPLLIVEFTEENAQLSGYSCSSLYELISSFGYNLYKYNWVRNELIQQANKEHFSYTNLICLKDTSIIQSRLKNIHIA